MSPADPDRVTLSALASYPTDREIVARYVDREPRDPADRWTVTFCSHLAHDLVVTVADLAVRSSAALGSELASLRHGALRDAAVGAAVCHYLPTLPPPGTHGIRNPIAERVVQSLIHRQDESLAKGLVAMSVTLSEAARQSVTRELGRVVGEPAVAAGQRPCDIGCSLIEAAAAEWMHLRALDLGLRVGPNPISARR